MKKKSLDNLSVIMIAFKNLSIKPSSPKKEL